MRPDARRIKFYKADVFTDQPFGGNPVAVFPDCEDLTNREFQQIAREMNLSETVFVLPPADDVACAKLRIFTPTKEIPFAGHPVIGTFHILATLKRFPVAEPLTRVKFESNIGIFGVDLYVLAGQIDRIVMSQPAPQFLGAVEGMKELYDVCKSLGVAKTDITATQLPIELVSTGLPVMIVPLRSLTAVKSINLDLTALNEVCARWGVNGIMAFSMMTVDDSAHVHTRMFAGPIGIVEDPATGSASGALGGYLVHNGVVDVRPISEIIAEQGYEIDRPSRIVIQVVSDDDMIREVKVGGRAVLVAEGHLML